jgi:prepilin-type N-terminal cleavage/methylation domain-containing protein
MSREAGAGFTLIELTLVAAVLALLLAVSIPRFAQTAERLRAEQAAFELAQLLRVAHERAVFEEREVVWTWDEQARRARIAAAAGAPGPDPDDGEPAMALRSSTAALPRPLTVSLTREDDAVDCQCIRFFPQGTSEATTVTLQFRSRRYTMQVDGTTSQVALTAGAAPR